MGERIMLRTLTLVGLLVTGTAVAAEEPAKTPAKKIVPKSGAVELSAEHNGKTVTVAVNKNITIRLAGNITTGSSWQVEKITGEAVKAQGEPDYVAGKHPPGLDGGGGTFVIKLRAVKPGKSTIKLVYGQPWEKKKPAEEDTFTTTIEVQKK
jgi:inhibitor of cysteine peptidase